jgi:type IV pilus assembly protein PilZ
MNGRGVGDSEKPASETTRATVAARTSCDPPSNAAPEADPSTPTPESGARLSHYSESAERTSSDRRSAERFDVMWSVDCETEETFLYAAITNISAMGIFVTTKEPLPIGTRITLRFAPPHSGDEFVLTGVVQWVNPLRPHEDNPNPGMGVRFSSLTPPDRERIVETIRTIAYLREEPRVDDVAEGGN